MSTWRQTLVRLPRSWRLRRRSLLGGSAALSALAAIGTSAGLSGFALAGEAPREVALSVPGPGNSLSLPVELAARLGLDRRNGIALRLRFVSGGSAVIKELASGNADYAVLGLPTVVDADLRGAQLLALAAIDDLPVFTLMVRQDLRDSVRRVSDLRGKVIGIHSNSLRSKTSSQQMLELLLRLEHVPQDRVRMVATGQTWETQSAALRVREVDAAVCDEPYSTRMAGEGLAVPLFSTSRPADAARLPGSGFLRAVLVARSDTVETDSLLAAQMVATIRATLQWMASHSPAEIAAGLGLAAGAERSALEESLRRHPRLYSRDGRFSLHQRQETETFFREAEADNPGARYMSLDTVIIDRWAGTKP